MDELVSSSDHNGNEGPGLVVHGGPQTQKHAATDSEWLLPEGTISGIETILVSEVLFYSGAAMLGCMGQNGKHGFWSGARAAFDICGDGNPKFCSKIPASGKDGPASESAVTRPQNHAGKEKM